MGIHEVIVNKQSSACLEAGRRPFAVWVHIATNVSHLLLVINGSVNSLIYCCLSSRFRAQFVRHWNDFCVRIGLRDENGSGNSTCIGRWRKKRKNKNKAKVVFKKSNERLNEDEEDFEIENREEISLQAVVNSNGLTTCGAAAAEDVMQISPANGEIKCVTEAKNGLTLTTQV